MILVISGTNRKDSRSLKVAKHYEKRLAEMGASVKLLSLVGIDVLNRGEAMKALEAELLVPAQKIVFVMPEYNGSFPGVLKTMMDNSDIRACWWHKKALLVGVADGRGGNLRGIEHMTNILHYLKMNVYYNKLPLSKINEEMDESGVFLQDRTIRTIEEQLSGFLSY